jgi:hypothetical protein
MRNGYRVLLIAALLKVGRMVNPRSKLDSQSILRPH